MYGTWKESWSAMDSNLKLIEDAYQHTLSKAVWEMDREALQAHIDSAAQIPTVGRISMTIRSSQRAPEILQREASGWSPSSLAPRRLELVYVPYPGAWSMWASWCWKVTNVFVESATQSNPRHALTQLLQSLLVAGLVMAGI